MDIYEFNNANSYVASLTTEAKNAKEHSRVKSKEFYSIMPLFVNANHNLMYRDFLDKDLTFSVLAPKDAKFSLKEVLDLYLSLCDTLEQLTFMKVKNTGFINLDGREGFWVVLK